MITIVRGNTTHLSIPLQKLVIEGTSKVVVDYFPEPTDVVKVRMVGGLPYTFEPTVSENVLTITIVDLPAATYGVEVLIGKQDGTKLRSYRKGGIKVVESTDEALDIPAGTEFDIDAVQLDAGVFIIAETDLSDYYTKEEIDALLSPKANVSQIATVNGNSLTNGGNVSVQQTLISGANIKWINMESLLGSGNISIPTPYWVELTGNETYTCNRSNIDIYNAYRAGNTLMCRVDWGVVLMLNQEPTPSGVYFSGASDTPYDNLVIHIYTDNNNVQHVSETIFTSQEALESGENIKTINNESLLGSGNITITSVTNVVTITGTSPNYVASQTATSVIALLKAGKEVVYQQGENSYQVNKYTESEQTDVVYASTYYDGTISIIAHTSNKGIIESEFVVVTTFPMYSQTQIDTALGGKQDTLVSGTNIKTVNNTSLLGSGNIDAKEVEVITVNDSTASMGGDEVYSLLGNNKVVVYRNGNNYYQAFQRYMIGLGSAKTYTIFALGGNGLDGTIDILRHNRSKIGSTITDTVTVYTLDLQEKLVSGTSIKTINSESLLGSGDISLATSSDVAEAKPFIVTLTESNNVWSADKTNAEIAEAIADGRTVMATSHSGENYFVLSAYDSVGNSYIFEQRGWEDDASFLRFTISENNNAQSVTLSSVDMQTKLVSGTSIKTINSASLLGSGNISLPTSADLITPIEVVTGGADVSVTLDAGKWYRIGEVTSSLTLALSATVPSGLATYFGKFVTGSTAPSLTLPSGVTASKSSPSTLNASSTYEFIINDGIIKVEEV